jgi:hypothetical protein
MILMGLLLCPGFSTRVHWPEARSGMPRISAGLNPVFTYTPISRRFTYKGLAVSIFGAAIREGIHRAHHIPKTPIFFFILQKIILYILKFYHLFYLKTLKA